MPNQATLVSHSFNGGETGEIVDARPDNQRRQSGCKKLLNMVSMAQGPATRRPGMLYLGEAKDQNVSNNVIIRDFVFSATEARQLEFSNLLMRVWKDDALVPDGGGDFEMVTPYTSAQLPYLRMKQSGDVIYVASPDHAPRKISRIADDDWEIAEIDFLPTTPSPENLAIENVTGLASKGKHTYEYVVTAVDTTGEESLASESETIYEVSALNSVDGNYNRLTWDKNAVEPLEYRVYKQDSGNFGFIGRVLGSDSYRFEVDVWGTYGGEFVNQSVDNEPDGTPNPVEMDEVALVRGTAGSLAAGEWGWNTANGGTLYVKDDPRSSQLICHYSYMGFTDDNIKADFEDPPPGDQDPFDSADNYPALVFMWQQRLGWGVTNNDPFTLQWSPSSRFESLAAGIPPTDDDAIEATLAVAKANKIQWVAGDRVLMLGTTGNEWSVGKVDEVLTPSNVGFTKQGNKGSEDVPALETGETLLFIQRGGNVVRELVYSYTGDKYESPDVSILASHLLDGKKVVAWAFQLNPFSVVWCVLDDGSLIGITYMREHEVVGWHRHTTDGFIEDICCTPGEGYDRVFFVVRRDVDGTPKRFIERFDNFFIRQEDKEDAFFVDSGVKYDSTETATLTNIAPHLKGRTVQVWADGVRQTEQEVSATGTVVLEDAASKVSLGIGYVSDITPNRPEVLSQEGTTMTRVYKVNRAKLKLYKSADVKAGASEDELEEVILHDAADPLVPRYIEAADEDVIIDTGWDDAWNFLVRADGPAPMTVRAVVYDIEIGDML